MTEDQTPSYTLSQGEGWRDIKTHPTDDRPFRVKTEGGFEFDVTWQLGFEREDGSEWGSWVAENEDYPESWTDGTYWRSNHDEVESDPPTHWMPLPPPPGQST